MVSPRALHLFVRYLEGLVDEGEEEFARKGIARLLLAYKDLEISADFRTLIATLLAPKKRGRGRPNTKAPQLWLVLGIANEKLQAKGVGPEESRFEQLSKQFAMSARTVERAVTHYRRHRNDRLEFGCGETADAGFGREYIALVEIAFPGVIKTIESEIAQSMQSTSPAIKS